MELPEVVITCIRLPAIHCTDPRIRSNSCACGAATTSARSAAPRTIAVTERSEVTPRAYTEAAAPRLSDVGPMHGLGHLHVVGECSGDWRRCCTGPGGRGPAGPCARSRLVRAIPRGRDPGEPGKEHDAGHRRRNMPAQAAERHPTPPVDRPAPSPPTQSGAF